MSQSSILNNVNNDTKDDTSDQEIKRGQKRNRIGSSQEAIVPVKHTAVLETPTTSGTVEAVMSPDAMRALANMIREQIGDDMNRACKTAVEDGNRELKEGMAALLRENADQKKRIVELETRIDSLEQDKRKTNLIVEGVHITTEMSADESKAKVVSELSRGLKMQINPDDVKYVQNISANRSRPGASSKVKMVFRVQATRDDIYGKKATLKGQKLWVNDDLTANRSKLAFDARRALKNKQIIATWVRDGEVFIRKSANDKPTRLVDQLS